MVIAVSIKLDDALKARVQHLAASQRRSAHWIMREAIQQYVEREEARASFRQEALTSWAEYQQTGQQLTGDETRAWLCGWRSQEGFSAPACRK